MDTNEARKLGRMMRRVAGRKQRDDGSGSSGGGGGRGGRRGNVVYNDKYNPPKYSRRITPIMLYPGHYSYSYTAQDGAVIKVEDSPFDIMFRHYNLRSRNQNGDYHRCSAGIKEGRNGKLYQGFEPCLGCYEAYNNPQGGIEQARMHNIFSGVKLTYYHMAPSKAGRIDRKTKQPYMDAYDCMGKNCELCRAGVKKEFARRIWWPIGPMFFGQLQALRDNKLRKTCECGGRVDLPAYECPQCRAVFHDFEENPISPEAEEEVMEALDLDKHQCKKCGAVTYMEPLYSCLDCGNPRPLDLWNTKMELYQTGSGTDAKLDIERARKLTDEELQAIEHITAHPVDLGLIKSYRMLTLQEQKMAYGVRIPDEYGGSPPAGYQTRGYEGQQGGYGNQQNTGFAGQQGQNYASGASAWGDDENSEEYQSQETESSYEPTDDDIPF